jgi:putative transposase
MVKLPRGTERYRPTQRDDEDTLTHAIVKLTGPHGRYGCRLDHSVAAADRLAGG